MHSPRSVRVYVSRFDCVTDGGKIESKCRNGCCYLSRCSCCAGALTCLGERRQITAELIDAARRRRGQFYGAITINSSKAIGDLFEKKYGIKLRHWRGDATELINRALAESAETGFDVTWATKS
jgi:hypothetical protein